MWQKIVSIVSWWAKFSCSPSRPLHCELRKLYVGSGRANLRMPSEWVSERDSFVARPSCPTHFRNLCFWCHALCVRALSFARSRKVSHLHTLKANDHSLSLIIAKSYYFKTLFLQPGDNSLSWQPTFLIKLWIFFFSFYGPGYEKPLLSPHHNPNTLILTLLIQYSFKNYQRKRFCIKKIKAIDGLLKLVRFISSTKKPYESSQITAAASNCAFIFFKETKQKIKLFLKMSSIFAQRRLFLLIKLYARHGIQIY